MIYVTPKKLHAKKEEKLLKRFWDGPLLHSILTDGRTDIQTDRRTTDNSALEKLRRLSADGAKNSLGRLSNQGRPAMGKNIFLYGALEWLHIIYILRQY